MFNVDVITAFDFVGEVYDIVTKCREYSGRDVLEHELKLAGLFDDFASEVGFDLLGEVNKINDSSEGYADTWLQKSFKECLNEYTENLDYILDMCEDNTNGDDWWKEYISNLYWDGIEMIEHFKKDAPYEDDGSDEKKLVDEYKKKRNVNRANFNNNKYNKTYENKIDNNNIREKCFREKMKDNDKTPEEIVKEVFSLVKSAEAMFDVLALVSDITADEAERILRSLIEDVEDYIKVMKS